MDRSVDILRAVIARLETDLGTTRIYTRVPDKETFPYLVIELTAEEEFTFSDAEYIYALRVRAFSKEKTPLEAIQLRSNVFNSLNRQKVMLDSGAIIESVSTNIDLLLEPDHKVFQSFIDFETSLISS